LYEIHPAMISSFYKYIAPLLCLLVSCGRERYPLPAESDLFGLASPVSLNHGETSINLEDYFTDAGQVDSVSLSYPLKVKLSHDHMSVVIHAPDSGCPPLLTMTARVHGVSYDILLRKSVKEDVVIAFDPGDRVYKEVAVAGQMNGWTPSVSPLKLKDGKWSASLLLNPGKYQYRLVTDGTWIPDPDNPDSVDNNMGSYNSVLTVGETVADSLPMLFTDRVKGGTILAGFTGRVDEFIVFWQNHRLDGRNYTVGGSSLRIHVPREARQAGRSYLRIWAYNRYGVSNDLLIPLEKGKALHSAAQLNRGDWEAAIIYFLMVDRFNNGSTGNDLKVDDPGILPRVNYFGGDLCGVTQKLKEGFFDELGINCIWLSPVVRNPLGAYGHWPNPETKFSGYHGYWPVSSSRVDFRYGTGEELSELIETAHGRGMNVILDYVAHHVHREHPAYAAHPDWFTSLYLPDGTKNTEKWDEYRLTTWFDDFLPTLDLQQPGVTAVMSDSALYWLTQYPLDGFRHDATKHIPEIFWRELTRKIKKEVAIPDRHRIYQIGETYGSRELIGSYIGSGMLDAQFDFNVYDDALAVFCRQKEPFTRLYGSLSESFSYYGCHNLMGYMTGNQDKPRFISLAGGALSFDENSKQAGWDREIGAGDPSAYDRLSQMMAFIMTISGIPTIYYGDEFGMPGANDPDNRRMMKFAGLDEREENLRSTTRKLTRLRRDNLALTFGDFQLLWVDSTAFAYARCYFDRLVVVAFNKDAKPREIVFDLPARFMGFSLAAACGSEPVLKERRCSVLVNPLSFGILTNQP
jgi:glycosidase